MNILSISKMYSCTSCVEFSCFLQTRCTSCMKFSSRYTFFKLIEPLQSPSLLSLPPSSLASISATTFHLITTVIPFKSDQRLLLRPTCCFPLSQSLLFLFLLIHRNFHSLIRQAAE